MTAYSGNIMELEKKPTNEKTKISLINGKFFISSSFTSFSYRSDLIIEDCFIEQDNNGEINFEGKARHYEIFNGFFDDMNDEKRNKFIEKYPNLLDTTAIKELEIKKRIHWWMFWNPPVAKKLKTFKNEWVLLRERKPVELTINGPGGIVFYKGFNANGFNRDGCDRFFERVEWSI